ncbi:MAG: Mov34/MPN/PAD-1 family protein [Armatimonadota bacterium]
MSNLPPPAPDDELQVELSSVELDPLPEEPDDCADALSLVFGREPSPPLVAISLDALQDMIGHGSVETNREVGGILVGRYAQTPQGLTTRLEDIVIADTAEASLTHVTFTHHSWTEIHRQLDSRDDGGQIVGWYHTHPGFGPFLSAHDLFIQRNFFSHRGHIALVLDPIQRLFAVFGWQDEAIVKSAGCRVYASEDQRTELTTLRETLRYAADGPDSHSSGLKDWFGSMIRR